ncbi:coiled-coil domain-containing protein 142 isoform X2 [Xiphophorus maculatus]|uniref:Coiled-coil domain containing 142 n=1 Tax=Xiphophorus maculatus TaxID=8083 RepID=A0A3B5PQ73_XIPMA|nr:coiled-coil domain-containing protein 142 isoform X2 [Xiphophorus maculatus]
MSRSLQRAEILFRSTFNPSLKCLFHVPSQDEEEENLVVAHNLVSRSSARLQRMQQHLLTVVLQGPPVGGGQMGSLPGQYRALWRLFEQRSLLLFIHEYTRRLRLSTAFVFRLKHLLQHQLRELHLMQTQVLPGSPSSRISLVSLSQEFRLHLNHWSFFTSRVHSDHYLRQALVSHTKMLEEMKQTLNLLGLQLLFLMEQCVYGILSVIGKTELDLVPRDVLEDILSGTDLYSQAVEEHKVQLRMLVLQEAHKSKFFSSLPKFIRQRASAVSVRSLMSVLAVHRAEMIARLLDLWISEESCHVCKVHCTHQTFCDDFRSPESECSCSFPKWTWEQLWQTYLTSFPLLVSIQPSVQMLSQKYSPIYSPNRSLQSSGLEIQLPVLVKLSSFQNKEESSRKTRTSQSQTCIPQSGLTQFSAEAAQSNLEGLGNCDCPSPSVATSHHASALPPPQLDQSSVEPLFQVLMSSTDLLAPLALQRPTSEEAAAQLVSVSAPGVAAWKAGSVGVTAASQFKMFSQQNVVGTNTQDWTRVKTTSGADAPESSGVVKDEDLRRGGRDGTRLSTVEPECVGGPHSVQWMDMGRSVLLADLLQLYQSQLLVFCTNALRLKLHTAAAGNAAGSINLQDDHRSFQTLHSVTHALETVACRGLGSALKDKCVRNESSSFAAATSNEEGRVLISQTMAHFLQLLPPLLSSLCCCQSNSSMCESFGLLLPSCVLQRWTVGLLFASIQISTVWIMSKANQFLSSWSPNKFLLVTQGDLRMLMESLDKTIGQTKSLLLSSDCDHHPTLQSHSQHLQRHQLEALDRAACELQAFSSMVLSNFSTDCKRMSGEIFERTMPSAGYWRPSQRTGFPRNPSEYASLAAQTVIGQVLEAVAPLSEDAHVQALTVTMTAFMEAWMEHILRQKIKFSLQGALQLKEDFDSVREMIKSDKYDLSAELHQTLLSLSVFQQVDSALLCLLQQPQAKPYLQRPAWESFTRCCPVKGSRDSLDTAAVGSNITNLGCVEGEELTQSDQTVHPPVDTSRPAEPYLALSTVLGATHQEWLDLRVHSSTRRWRLPGLQCLSKMEP